eukprot:scaffold94903_cov66-Phaeocystis_antarctica.AAC.2
MGGAGCGLARTGFGVAPASAAASWGSYDARRVVRWSAAVRAAGPRSRSWARAWRSGQLPPAEAAPLLSHLAFSSSRQTCRPGRLIATSPISFVIPGTWRPMVEVVVAAAAWRCDCAGRRSATES